jgi:alpha-L-fucosidase
MTDKTIEDGEGFAGAFQPSQYYTPPRDPAVLAKLAKFQDLKLGLIIHWGPYSQWGIDASWSLCPEQYEWNKRPGVHADEDDRTYQKSYEALKSTFNPVRFNAEKWADIAADAGARYVVFTTKHHDGFCMWDTQQTDYKITSADCPFHADPRADIVKEVFDAFRQKNFWIGAYFSKPDWNTPYYWNPDYPLKDRNHNYDIDEHPELWNKFKNLTQSQINELMTGYGAIDVLWLDGGQVRSGNKQDIDMPGIAATARRAQPGLIVVDRVAGGGYEDYLTPEGTHAMPSHYLPDPWEACMTLGDAWAYTPHSRYHTVAEIIHYLIRAVARNGNLLLGIGPDAAGEFSPIAVERLRGIGEWLRINGEAIYGTRPIPPYEDGCCAFTCKPDGTRYAIIIDENAIGLPASVTLPASIAEGVDVTMLGAGCALAMKRDPSGTFTIEFPEKLQLTAPAQPAWVLKLKPSR